jgi:hypothetical protein
MAVYRTPGSEASAPPHHLTDLQSKGAWAIARRLRNERGGDPDTSYVGFLISPEKSECTFSGGFVATFAQCEEEGRRQILRDEQEAFEQRVHRTVSGWGLVVACVVSAGVGVLWHLYRHGGW